MKRVALFGTDAVLTPSAGCPLELPTWALFADGSDGSKKTGAQFTTAQDCAGLLGCGLESPSSWNTLCASSSESSLPLRPILPDSNLVQTGNRGYCALMCHYPIASLAIMRMDGPILPGRRILLVAYRCEVIHHNIPCAYDLKCQVTTPQLFVQACRDTSESFQLHTAPA
jgi:hypothetical protein